MSTFPVFGAHEAKVYFIEESTYGVTPDSPDMVAVGIVQEIEPLLNPGLIKVRGIGSRDLQCIRRGLRLAELKIVYCLQNMNFLQHISTLYSLSVEVIYEKTSTLYTLLHKGCRINKLTIEASAEKLMKATAELIGQDVAVGSSKVGANYGDYSDPPLAWYDTYVKKDAVVLERVTDYSFTVENNLQRVPVIRSSNGHLLKYLPERHRTSYGEIVCDFETKEELEDIVNDTEFTLEFGLGGSHKAVFSGCKWDSSSIPTRVGELVSQRLHFIAKNVSIT